MTSTKAIWEKKFTRLSYELDLIPHPKPVMAFKPYADVESRGIQQVQVIFHVRYLGVFCW